MTLLSFQPSRKDPLLALGCVIGLALVLLALRPYQPLAAGAAAGLGLVLAAIKPRYGLFFTLFSAPFFLGEPQDPFVILVEVLAGVTLVSWLIRLVVEKRRPRIPYLGWLVLAGGLILFNPALNLKELWTSLQVLDLSQVLFLLAEGRKFHDLFTLRSLILHLGGLLFLACCLDLLEPEDLTPLGLGLAGITACLGVVSLLLYWRVLPTSGFYLGLNLQGKAARHFQEVLATTAFNRQYFNQLLMPFLAVAGGLAAWGRSKARIAAGAMVLLSLAIMFLSGQRSPFLCLAGMGLAGGALLVRARGREALPKALTVGLAVLGLVAGLAVLDLALGLNLVTARLLGLPGAAQISGTELRPQVWGIVGEMFKAHPLTGLGPGTFRLYAREFAGLAGLTYSGPLQEVVGTAHNSFLHWLAELGLPFLGVVLILGGLFIRDGLTAFRKEDKRLRAGVILVALTGLWVFALFQHIFYVSSVALLILTGLAGLANLADRMEKPARRRKVWTFLGLALVLAVLSCKVWAIAHIPYRSAFKVGFSYGEWYDGRERWWTVGRNAAIRYWASHPYLVVPVRNPHPVVEGRPMEVTVWAQDGEKKSMPVTVTIKDHEWHELKLDVREFRDRDFYIRLHTGYAFWPARYGATGDRRMLGVMVMDPYAADK